jgi:hypothetical protein
MPGRTAARRPKRHRARNLARRPATVRPLDDGTHRALLELDEPFHSL